jgi:hypothetical protein
MAPSIANSYKPVAKKTTGRGGKREGSGRKRKASAVQARQIASSHEDVPLLSVEVGESGEPFQSQVIRQGNDRLERPANVSVGR